jgi:hypothetical protein
MFWGVKSTSWRKINVLERDINVWGRETMFRVQKLLSGVQSAFLDSEINVF